MATTPLPGAGEFPSNAHAQKKIEKPVVERPAIKKVVTGTVVEHKKSAWQRFRSMFTIEDAGSVIKTVFTDVLLPSVNNLIVDTLTTTVERTFGNGGVQRQGYRPGSSYGPYTPYNRAPQSTAPWGQQQQAQQQMSRRSRQTHDFRECVIDNRQEAAIVLDTLTQMVDMYDVATVADFYDAVGFTSEYTDRNWGWNDLRDAQIMHVRGGYLIQFPQPIQLK